MSPSPPRTALVETGLFFLLTLVLSLGVQFSFPQLIGSDGFFHLRVAQDPLGEMPWMPRSVFGGGWVDHQLLFHVLMAPFAWLIEGIAAAKASAAFFAALALTACFRFLRQEGTPAAAFFALLPAAVSWLFVLRMEMPRTQALSLLFVVLALSALQRGTPMLLFALSWAYMASYHVALLLLPIALLHTLLRRKFEGAKTGDWRAVTAVFAGLLAGLSIHPHSPRTFGFLKQHVIDKVANREALPVGGEWVDGLIPLLGGGLAEGELSRFVGFSAGPCILLALAVLLWVRAGARRSPEGLLLLLLAGGACLGLLAGSKAIEYAAPLSALALGLAVRDGGLGRSRPVALSLGAGLVLLLLVGASGLKVRDAVRVTEPPPDRFAAALDFLRDQASPQETIYHFDWGDFPELVWHAPEFRYIVGLDPHFLQLEEPGLWTHYDRMASCFHANPSVYIYEFFEARWALVSLPWPGARQCMAGDPRMELIFESPGALLYRVRPRKQSTLLPGDSVDDVYEPAVRSPVLVPEGLAAPPP